MAKLSNSAGPGCLGLQAMSVCTCLFANAGFALTRPSERRGKKVTVAGSCSAARLDPSWLPLMLAGILVDTAHACVPEAKDETKRDTQGQYAEITFGIPYKPL